MKTMARAEEINLGFQIAPMIDVVFVIMLFFVMMASAMKSERQFSTCLPKSDPFTEYPDEIWIQIDEAGVISMNDEEMAGEQEVNPVRLTSLLAQIQQDAVARGSKTMVTLQTEPETRYQRIMDVLNALAKAKISDVTFTIGSDDG